VATLHSPSIGTRRQLGDRVALLVLGRPCIVGRLPCACVVCCVCCVVCVCVCVCVCAARENCGGVFVTLKSRTMLRCD
jgi:hypothetical protein